MPHHQPEAFYADANIHNSIELEERSGTDEDRDKLREAITSFGAECLVFNDLTREELLDTLDRRKQRANCSQYFWIVVCVLSHGVRVQGVDHNFCCNGVGVDRNIVSMKLNCISSHIR